MPGMFFELFILLTLLIVGFFSAALAWRKFWPMLIVFILMLMAGSVLMSDGIRYESGSHYVDGATTYDYNILRVGEDLTVTTFGYGYFYGSFAVAVITLGLLVWGRGAGVER